MLPSRIDASRNNVTRRTADSNDGEAVRVRHRENAQLTRLDLHIETLIDGMRHDVLADDFVRDRWIRIGESAQVGNDP